MSSSVVLYGSSGRVVAAPSYSHLPAFDCFSVSVGFRSLRLANFSKSDESVVFVVEMPGTLSVHRNTTKKQESKRCEHQYRAGALVKT